MSRPILSGLIALALLCILCIKCHSPAIEADLLGGARQALIDQGLDPDLVTISGRDLTLNGTIADDAARASALAALGGVHGVRVVNDQLTVATVQLATTTRPQPSDGEQAIAEAPTAAETEPLSWITNSDGLVLRGADPSEAWRDRLVSSAQALWGANRVTDRLTVDAAANLGADDRDFGGILRTLHARGDGGLDTTLEVHADGERLIVTGEVLSELARERILGALAVAMPDVELVDRLTVRPPSSDAETLQASLDAQMTGKIVEFETNSDRLTTRGRTVLDELTTIFTANPGRVEISGHTDSTGNPAFNLDLSKRRAASARRYLVDKGLDNNRFTTVGHGASRPIADNATAEGRQRNRRTAFRALEDK